VSLRALYSRSATWINFALYGCLLISRHDTVIVKDCLGEDVLSLLCTALLQMQHESLALLEHWKDLRNALLLAKTLLHSFLALV